VSWNNVLSAGKSLQEGRYPYSIQTKVKATKIIV